MVTDVIPLLETLLTDGVSFSQSSRGYPSDQRLYQALGAQVGGPMMKQEDLTALIKGDTSFSTAAHGRFIRLEDTNDGSRSISPLIYVDGDFRETHPRFCIQLVVVTHSTAGDKPQCLLLRFETPEGKDPSGHGKHDYYHSQLCKDLRSGGPNDTIAVPDSISWLTLSCPAWPLDAKSPIHLLACVVFSLYGKLEGARILRKAYGDKFAERLSGMHFMFEVAPPPFAARKTTQPRKSRSRKK